MSSGGQVFGGIVGAVAGALLGPPGLAASLYGAQIGMTLGGLIDPPKGPTVNGPRLDDLSVQTSTYGAVIPRVYGTVTVNGNVFWLENNRLKETVTKKKSGGKGGGSKTTTRTYTYSATFAVGLCKGPIVGVRRIWVGPDLIYDAGSSDPGTIAASNAAASGFRLYTGTDTQAADARLQATLGVANTPAWRGLAYLVFYDLALARYANSLAGAQVRVEVVTSGSLISAGASDASVTITASYYDCAPRWDGTRWFFIGRGINVVMFSADGISFTTVAALPNAAWKDIAFNGSMYLAVAAGNPQWMANSTDLVNWSWWSYPTSRLWTWIVHGPADKFLVVESGVNANLTSDNVNFAPSNMGITCQCKPAWNGSVFCVLGALSSVFKCVTSPDGVTWSAPVSLPSGITQLSPGGVCANGTTFLAVAWDNALTLGKVSLSSDHGATWSAWVALPSINPSAKWCAPVYGAGQYCVISTSTRDWATSPDGVNWTLYTGVSGGDLFRGGAGFNGSFFARVNDSLVTGQSAFTILQLSATSVITSTPVPLSSIVSAECLQSGQLSGGDVDVTALASQQVRGYRIGSVGAIRAALEPLQAAWPFDVVQHGYVIRFVARGGASVVTIAAADLDARHAGERPGVQITTSREMDSQLPRRVTVQHLDYDREYNTGTQYAERLNTAAINARVLDLPIVLTATEAAGKAEVLLYLYWLERYDVAVTLPPTYNQLEPGDVVTLVTPEGNVSLRLTAVHYTSDGRLECQAKYASAAIYTPTAVGSSPAWTGPTTITPVGASVYVLLDVPMINSAQSGPSFLVAMTGALAGWDGGVLMQSTDAGSTWATLQDFGPPGSSMGTCTNSIGVVEHRMVDSASLLNVTLTQGALYSVTQLAMLGGANHFAYGADGRWEIIAAQNCALVSGTSYVLQNLLRGRFGSEWAMGLHAVGDALVLLDTTDVAAIAMSAGTIGLSYLYRGITVDRDISTDSNRAFAYQGVNLRPLSPIYLTGNRDAGNDWTLTWIRRTRDGGEWRDYVDASLGEASESYAIDVYADGSYTTVKRTITASSPSCVYDSADQVSDFGANQATLYLKIYQISATVGRGYPLTTSITR
ncbi:MAG TPA: hypothetical protein DHV85_14490 [Candidatus Accumulibacter sp.]|nr:hypothetical protein [Accumulibacter sp.]